MPDFEYGDVFRGELIVTKEYYSKCCATNYASSRSVVNSPVALKDHRRKIKLDLLYLNLFRKYNLEKQLPRVKENESSRNEDI